MIRKVYLVLWWFADTGGMEQHVANLGRALVGHGIEVEVFVEMPIRRRSDYLRQLREARIPVHFPPSWTYRMAHSKGLRRNVRGVLGLLLSPFLLAQQIWWRLSGRTGPQRDVSAQIHDMVHANPSRWLARRILEKQHRRSPADVIHVHGFRLDEVWALRWARASGIPCMYTEHGTISDWGELWEEDAPEGVLHADLVSCVSKRSRESLYEFIPRETPVLIAPLIVAGPETALSQSRFGLDGDKNLSLRVTCIARLQSEKGGDPLVRAMRRVADVCPMVSLSFAGDGPDRQALESLVASLGLEENVVFRGRFSPSELPLVMEETDIIVLPSLTEGLPLTLIEAMAFGKPIVATRSGGIPELIRHGENGLLVAPDDEEALAAALVQLVGDRALCDRVGAAARGDFKVSEFAEDAALSETLELYKRALEHDSAPERKGAACAS